MWRDDAWLLDMLIAARKAVTYTQGMTVNQFATNELAQNAVIRVLEIVGEAARQVSLKKQDAHPEIPWAELVGLRNRLIHEYFRIDVEKVWDMVRDEIPGLIVALEQLVPPER